MAEPSGRRHALPAFFALAYGISWASWLPLVASTRGLLPLPLPFAVLWTLGGWGPTVAGVIAAGRFDGRAGLRSLLAATLRWRVAPVWYAVVLLLPAGIGLAAIGVNALLGGPVPAFTLVSPWYLPALALIGSLASGPLSEELGWRGFALPRMQERYGPLGTSLALGLLWALWHLPLFFIEGTSQAGMPLLCFAAHGVAMTLLFTWVYNHTRGSVLMAVLLHAAINTSFAVVPIVPTLTGDMRLYLLAIALTWAVATAVVALHGLRPPAAPTDEVAPAT